MKKKFKVGMRVQTKIKETWVAGEVPAGLKGTIQKYNSNVPIFHIVFDSKRLIKNKIEGRGFIFGLGSGYMSDWEHSLNEL